MVNQLHTDRRATEQKLTSLQKMHIRKRTLFVHERHASVRNIFLEIQHTRPPNEYNYDITLVDTRLT